MAHKRDDEWTTPPPSTDPIRTDPIRKVVRGAIVATSISLAACGGSDPDDPMADASTSDVIIAPMPPPMPAPMPEPSDAGQIGPMVDAGEIMPMPPPVDATTMDVIIAPMPPPMPPPPLDATAPDDAGTDAEADVIIAPMPPPMPPPPMPAPIDAGHDAADAIIAPMPAPK